MPDGELQLKMRLRDGRLLVFKGSDRMPEIEAGLASVGARMSDVVATWHLRVRQPAAVESEDR